MQEKYSRTNIFIMDEALWKWAKFQADKLGKTSVSEYLFDLIKKDKNMIMPPKEEKRIGCDFCDEEAVDFSYLTHPDYDHQSTYYTCLKHSKLTEEQLVEILKVDNKTEETQ